LIADWYALDRQRSDAGRPEAVSLAALLPAGARVLDIGCGPGVPVTRAMVDAGLQVVGLLAQYECEFARPLGQYELPFLPIRL